MKYYDISQILEKGMLKYPTAGEFELVFERDYELGSGMALSHFQMPTHLGTHLDSPYHMIEGGKRMEDLEAEIFFGKCQVLTLKDRDFISAADLKEAGIKAPRLIFKTDNYERITSGNFDNVYFTADAGEYMAEHGVKLVGIDYFSVDQKGDKTRKAHKAILGNDMAILEGIFPQDVPDGIYFMMCQSLRIRHIEGCPCRVFLMEYPELQDYLDKGL